MNICRGEAAVSEQPELIFPRVMSEPIKQVLSIMVWKSGQVARRLRELGTEIPCKAEEEQAYVLHWFLTLALEHGDRWLDVAWEHLFPGSREAEVLQ